MNHFGKIKNLIRKGLLFLIPFLGLMSPLSAQSSDSLSMEWFLAIIAGFLVLTTFVLIVVILLLWKVQKLVFGDNAVNFSFTWWHKINRRFISGEFVSIEKEREMVDLGHSYDGIREMDYPMPPWLKYLFYATILFGVYYTAAYLVLGTGVSQYDEYEAQLEDARLLAEARAAESPEVQITYETVGFDDSKEALDRGEEVYIRRCAQCHAADGGGGVGPNLTDQFWIHGGSIRDIWTVIVEGVPEKGMIPWKDQLSSQQIQDVASYIVTLEGKEAANPKKPQGDLFERSEEDLEPLESKEEEEENGEETESESNVAQLP